MKLVCGIQSFNNFQYGHHKAVISNNRYIDTSNLLKQILLIKFKLLLQPNLVMFIIPIQCYMIICYHFPFGKSTLTHYYLTDAMIERISLAFTKRILRITPQVARRSGWNKHGHNEAFYIKFRSEEGRDEVSISSIIPYYSTI